MGNDKVLGRDELERAAERHGIDVDSESVRPWEVSEDLWDLPRSIGRTLRSAELERQWAATDEVNASSSGYFPRGMSRSARWAHGAAMASRAQSRWTKAMDHEAAARALQRLAELLGIETGWPDPPSR